MQKEATSSKIELLSSVQQTQKYCTEAYKCTTGARTQGFTNVLYNGLLNTGTHKCTKYPKIQGLTHVQQILKYRDSHMCNRS